MKVRPLVLICAVGAVLSGCTSASDRTWHEEAGYRWAPLSFTGEGAGFTRLSPDRTGISFNNTLTEESLTDNRHTMNGSGVAIGDIDGDDWPDVYFARLDGANVLYRNLGGWRFEDITDAAGVSAPNRFSTGAVFADLEGDGDLDLLVTALDGPNAVFLNDGLGNFTDATDAAGLTPHPGSTTMALADVEGDGDLDLYIAAYKWKSVRDLYPPQETFFERTVLQQGDSLTIAPQFEAHYRLEQQGDNLVRLEIAEPDLFYLNDGDGTFSEVAFDGGAFMKADGTPMRDIPDFWGLTARFQDFNGDGIPDLYVCNDFESEDLIWIGDGDGGFRAIDSLAIRKTSLSTMSVDFSDIDNDGNLDVFTTDMLSRDPVRYHTQVGLSIPMTTQIGQLTNRPQAVQNMLFLNRGDGTYAEGASLAGVAASGWSWSGLFLDVDLDGLEDILITTGNLYDVQDADVQQEESQKMLSIQQFEAYKRLILDYPPLLLPNIAFRNRGDETFEFVPEGWGLGDGPDVSQGIAFGDLDLDGDLDAVVNRLNQVAGVYRNEAPSPRLAVRLRGDAPNTKGIGASIRLVGRSKTQSKEIVSGGQYLSGSEAIHAFAALDDSLRIVVRWRSGRVSTIENARPDRIYEIYESAASEPAATSARVASGSPLFEETLTNIRHVENSFTDFDRQPLIPWDLSRLGPALAWVDLNGDEAEDLLVGSGQGANLSAFRNEGGGHFAPLEITPPDSKPAGDLTGIVAMPLPDGGARVLAGASNYEGSFRDASWVDVYETNAAGRLTPVDRLSFGMESIGPLALADIDGDDDLDLFAGSRVVQGQYPNAGASKMYRNDGGKFTLDADWSAPFANAGMVSSAAFGDLDADGDADLLLAVAWGPLRYFENDGTGRLTDATDRAGLGDHTGRWNGVAIGDFNGDGRLDAVATNWGWNTRHGRVDDIPQPLRLYYDDFDANGITDPITSHYEASLDRYVTDRGLSVISIALPYVASRMPTYRRFAESSMLEILGPKLNRASSLEASTLSHSIFINTQTQGGSPVFNVSPLPREAQLSVAFAPVIADFDGDGNEDVFLSQNLFALPMDVPRIDAGRGLLLLGDGAGAFQPAPADESGLTVYGEQRAAAAADWDRDGRIDLAVSQNGAPVRLFRNAGASPGIHVRLQHSTNNPGGIGATVRMRYEDGVMGPARLISAGSGYWSQMPATQVMGRIPEKSVETILVRWPDGSITEKAHDSNDGDTVIVSRLPQ